MFWSDVKFEGNLKRNFEAGLISSVADTIRRYSYFMVVTASLPTFYQTLWELSNRMVVHLYLQQFILKLEIIYLIYFYLTLM